MAAVVVAAAGLQLAVLVVPVAEQVAAQAQLEARALRILAVVAVVVLFHVSPVVQVVRAL